MIFSTVIPRRIVFMTMFTMKAASGQMLLNDPVSGITAWTPLATFNDADFLYKRFRPATNDPQQGDWYFRTFVPPSYDPQGTENGRW